MRLKMNILDVKLLLKLAAAEGKKKKVGISHDGDPKSSKGVRWLALSTAAPTSGVFICIAIQVLGNVSVVPARAFTVTADLPGETL